MKPNIVFLDEYTLGGADLTRLHELGRYTGYSTTAPDEVAEAIYFLAGERAAFITGQVLSVNGGMVIG